MRRGYTLIELSLVLVLAGVTCLSLLSTARRLRDRMAVVAAREAVAGLFARARVDAILTGGSAVHVQSVPSRAWMEGAQGAFSSVELATDLSVTVTLGGGRSSADMQYDALGIGRVASETMTFHRGRQQAQLIVSGYGRVRRR